MFPDLDNSSTFAVARTAVCEAASPCRSFLVDFDLVVDDDFVADPLRVKEDGRAIFELSLRTEVV